MSEEPYPPYLRRLKRVILDLPRLQREIFLASRFGSLSYVEIARRTGLTPEEVKQELAKAVLVLSREMRRHWQE